MYVHVGGRSVEMLKGEHITWTITHVQHLGRDPSPYRQAGSEGRTPEEESTMWTTTHVLQHGRNQQLKA